MIPQAQTALFLLIASVTTINFVHADVNFVITNKDGGPIRIGIQGNPGNDNLRNGGFVLNQGQTETVAAPDNWQGRFWSRTYCDPSSNHCLTGDCGNKLECAGSGGEPPVTLVEITLKSPDDGKDYYDLSLVDGFNTGASIEPINGQGDGSQYSCKKAQCGNSINGVCPPELQVKDGDTVIACKSACLRYNTDEYCCRGEHNTEPTCRSSTWKTDYPKIFKDQCPDAYSYAFDDAKALYTCKASEYDISFGNV